MSTKRFRTLLVWLCSAAVVIAGSLTGLSPAPKAYAANATLAVDAATVVAPMKKEMRGTNIGLWTQAEFHPISTRSERYVNLLKEAGISLIRFPAGSEADTTYWDRTNTYDYYEGPGPYDTTLTAEVFDSYMAMLDEVGAEAMVTVNARINDPDLAADLVHYANVEKGWNIKYWEIGNEPEYYEGVYAVTPQQYAQRIMEYTAAMKAVDPSIQIIGPANGSSLLAEWVQPILSTMQAANEQLEGITVHWYPLAGEQTNPASAAYPSIDNLLRYEGTDWQPAYINWIGKFTETTPTHNLVNYRNTYAPGAMIGLTELGHVTRFGEGIADSHAGAIWMADVLGRLAYHQIDFVMQFLLQGNQTYSLMNMNKEVRPTYYVYPLLKRYFGDTMVASSSSDNQNFTIWASKRAGDNDKLYLMVINKHQTQDLSATINLSGFQPQSTASSWVLNAPAIDSLTGTNINGVEVAANGTLPTIAPNKVTGVSNLFTRVFPAHSVTMMELTAEGAEQGNGETAYARYLAQYADAINERKAAADYPGNTTATPQGWGKIWATGHAEWTVNFPSTGVYDYGIRAYGEGTAPSFQIQIDGMPVPNTGASPTASWNDYSGSLGTVTAGTHKIRIHNNSPAAGNNIDVAHIEISGAAPGPFSLTAPADSASLGSNSVTLDWTQQVGGRSFAPHGADEYSIHVADNASFINPTAIDNLTGTTYLLDHLDYGMTYYWKVIALNANGMTVSDDTFSFTTPPPPASPVRYSGQYAASINERKAAADYPGNMTDTPEGWGKIWATGFAEWTVKVPTTGSYDFTVRAYGEGSSPSFRVLLDGQPVSGANWSPTAAWTNYQGSFGTLTAGTHTIRIHNNSASAGNNINLAHMDILGAAPSPFSLTSPANNATLGSSSITLNWNQTIDGRTFAPFGAQQYTVTVADNPAFSNPIVQATVNTPSYSLNNLQSGTYYWNVTAINAFGTTAANASFSFTAP
ncbi:carbohydrate-binding protein [Cohnella hongkongensis]|uniref:Carbohydrate-binding protein n=1 Tax=Cohnella hongkongensis TaxID=178337 RepID=A0ABV9FGI2_9BACL